MAKAEATKAVFIGGIWRNYLLPDVKDLFGNVEKAVNQVESDFTDHGIAKVTTPYELKLCKGFRATLREIRTSVEKKRVEAKAYPLEWGRELDAEAKRLISYVEPVENVIGGLIEEREAEIERERKELERRAEEARLEAARVAAERMDLLRQVGAGDWHTIAVVAQMSEEDFRVAFAAAEESHRKKTEWERIRKEEEAAELAKQKAELEEERRKLQEEREKLQAENAKIAAAVAEQARQEAERQAKEAEAKAVADAYAAKEDRVLTIGEFHHSLVAASERAHRFVTFAREWLDEYAKFPEFGDRLMECAQANERFIDSVDEMLEFERDWNAKRSKVGAG